MPDPILDPWAAWLLHRRHGGDPAALRRTLERLAFVRDRVLDNAGIGPGETLLDVGTGDGLIAFGALGRVGERGSVVFSDVSEDLLAEARGLATYAGVLDRCRFVPAAAEHLVPIADASIDAVTTRPVLAYVAAKQEAFAEFARVLRPGGPHLLIRTRQPPPSPRTARRLRRLRRLARARPCRQASGVS